MNGPDVSGLDPARAPEVLRRIAEIKAYTASGRTAADREDAAGRLGITPGQFLRLVRAWRETGDAANLSGAGRPAGTTRAPRLADPIRRAIEAAIADLGAAAGVTAVTGDVARRCAALGVRAPSPSTIERHLQRARRLAAEEPATDGGIVVARCDLRLPMIEDGRLVEPSAIIAAFSPGGIIAGARLDGADSGMAQILADIGLFIPDRANPPVIALHAALANEPNLSKCTGLAVHRSGAARLDLARMLGDRIGSIQIAFGDTSAGRLRQKVRSRLNTPLRRDQVETALEQAVRLHNATRTGARRSAYGAFASSSD